MTSRRKPSRRPLVDRDGYFTPAVLQALGALIIVGAVLLWVFTDRQSQLIMGTGMALVAIGQYKGTSFTIGRRPRVEEDNEK